MLLHTLDELRATLSPLMAGLAAPWCVAGGWAIDLFLGRSTRSHGDLEVAIFRQDQLTLRRFLNRWDFEKIVDGRREPWLSEQHLDPPVHEVHARSIDEPTHNIEFLLNERDGDHWIYRRNSAITLAVDRAILHVGRDGLPILSPEIVLLFKAKAARPKDELDFRAAHPKLESSRRRWLSAALRTCHPSHSWLPLLENE